MSTITKLNNDIIASTIIDNWGGECINKTGGDTPVGIGVQDGNSNTFGYNDAFDVSAYMYTDDIQEGNEGGFNKVIRINIFQKKVNDSMDSYQAAMNLHHYLTRRKFDVTIGLDKSVKCEFCYFAFLVVDLRAFANC